MVINKYQLNNKRPRTFTVKPNQTQRFYGTSAKITFTLFIITTTLYLIIFS